MSVWQWLNCEGNRSRPFEWLVSHHRKVAHRETGHLHPP